MGGGKYLLIEFDKKWMWGLVVRRYAKSCAKLGLTKKYFKAYHRNHINKVMMTAFIGLAFEDIIENGGEAIKLGLFRAQSYKVAEKEVREGVRQADGTMPMIGPVKRRQDDLYLVDCAITGSSDGTSKDPKCSLQRIFKHNIFPSVRSLVGSGGKFEGYKPVCTGDSAGPHVKKDFLEFIRTSCEREGWAWEPQVAQIPHNNVLDLAVSPCISRRHSALARQKGCLHVLKEDEIWKAALEVWQKLPNCKIASGYVLSYRIAKKVIAHNGDNSFLGE